MDTTENIIRFPKTLVEAVQQFSDPEEAHRFAVMLRWPGGVVCTGCGSDRLSFIRTRKTWACKVCKKRFTVKTGSLMEDSPLKLSAWMTAVWLITGAKNGISSYEVARAVGVCQKTAWFLLHRVRAAMVQGSFEKFSGTVEADETFIGGKEKNKHADKKLRKGRGGVGKQIVMGILERAEEKGNSQVRVKVVPDTTHETLRAEITANVEPGAEVFTDAHRGYQGLSDEYKHAWVDHAVKYAEGRVHSNGIENFWCLFDRMLDGTYTHVDPRHLQSYLDEEAYRFNERKLDDGGRFTAVVCSLPGKRLTWKELTERGLSTFEP